MYIAIVDGRTEIICFHDKKFETPNCCGFLTLIIVLDVVYNKQSVVLKERTVYMQTADNGKSSSKPCS